MRSRRLAALPALAGVCLVVLAAPAPAGAAKAAPQVAVVAVGQEQSSFEVTLAPGERRRLAIQVANPGSVPVTVRTYAAEAYSLINGGLAARFRNEGSGGTATWLDYRPETLHLEPDTLVARAFTVSAPAAVAPGEYITTVVVEHDVPGQPATRHVVAVALTVPGPIVAGLAPGAGWHTAVDGRSVVGLEVRNTGNTHLRPEGELVVAEATGAVVHRGAVAMGSVFAHSATFVEQSLDRLLPPGAYMISASLADAAKGVDVTAAPVPLEVAASELVPPRAGRLSAIAAPVASMATGLLLAIGAVTVGHRRRRRREGSLARTLARLEAVPATGVGAGPTGRPSGQGPGSKR